MLKGKYSKKNWPMRDSSMLPVKRTWWVTFIPTARISAPLVKTISAESGSPKICPNSPGPQGNEDEHKSCRHCIGCTDQQTPLF